MEDDTPLAIEWKNAFELNGFKISLAQDGDEAMTYIDKEDFDLVITDLFVGEGAGGLHVLLKLFKAGKSSPPAIAVTGARGPRNSTGPDTNIFLDQARKLGTAADIEKPFPAGELVLLAQTVLESS